jgi:hypothetical protein
VNRTVSFALNTTGTYVRSRCPGGQEAFLKDLTGAEELDLGLDSLARLLMGGPVSFLAVFTAVASRPMVDACDICAFYAAGTDTTGGLPADGAGVGWCVHSRSCANINAKGGDNAS